MHMEFVPVEREDKGILRNLLEKYDYEFSQYDLRDVNKHGLYDYCFLDHYWTEDNRWAFFLLADGKLAGFVMVNDYPEVDTPTDYTMSEFFVMYKYRRCGLGRFAVQQLFERFHGRWQLKYHTKNTASVAFWNKVVSDATGGHYEVLRDHPDAVYPDGTPGEVLVFET